MDNDKEFFGDEPQGRGADTEEPGRSMGGISYGEEPKSSLKNIFIAVAFGAILTAAAVLLTRRGKDENRAGVDIPSPTLPIRIAKTDEVEDKAATADALEAKIAEVSPENAKAPAELVKATPKPAAQPKSAPAKIVKTPAPVKTVAAPAKPALVERPTDVKGEVEIVSAPTPAAPVKAAAGQVSAKRSEAGWSVQILSGTTEEKTRKDWDAMVRKHPDLLKNQAHAIVKADVDGKTYFRLRATGFNASADATAFCGKLKAYSISCFVTK
ncbi:MAG: SPOR domain-containing protein [Rickettsiales bacterium]|jgi:hypothetical protein|nr:SPOR domain-containing protein [Rickettsiales bacterium]